MKGRISPFDRATGLEEMRMTGDLVRRKSSAKQGGK